MDVTTRSRAHFCGTVPIIGALALALAACNTATGPGLTAGPAVAPLVAVTVTDLPGKWGLASYRTEADRARTEKEAKSACGNPYVIGAGSKGGVVMHLADQTQPTEVFLKVANDGRSFLGPRGAAGVKQDRLIVSYQNNVLVTQWMDASAQERYGTMVFVRCAAT